MPKLLVVDDDLDMLALVRAALEKDGHQVDAEADAAALCCPPGAGCTICCLWM